jgi:outer membrane protein assembly factor BamB
LWFVNQASGGAVYVGSNVGVVYELSMSTGAITGSRDAGGGSVTVGSPSMDSFTNRLYATTSEGNFYAFAAPF